MNLYSNWQNVLTEILVLVLGVGIVLTILGIRWMNKERRRAAQNVDKEFACSRKLVFEEEMTTISPHQNEAEPTSNTPLEA